MLLFSGHFKKDALKEMKSSTAPPTRTENYGYLKKIWSSENMSTFKDYLEWYNNKDVVPTLEALQNMKFYHERQIDMLKLGYTAKVSKYLSLTFFNNTKVLPIH